MDENISDNIQSAYELAEHYHDEDDTINAEKWALKAMELGGENKAPQLLAKIALETKSKSSAITLASYFFKEHKDFEKALVWANIAIKFGSESVAPQLLEKIALETKSKDIAFKLALYYLKRSDVVNAKRLAEKAIEFHSQSAVKLLVVIEAHRQGLLLQEEVREINREMGLHNSKMAL
ncbi:MAG TPA: hypothetical protein VGV92_07095 [Gammaproteobacteria bacterium]|nr:hypothetical protein [Gammaproteobacteria bacterium]